MPPGTLTVAVLTIDPWASSATTAVRVKVATPLTARSTVEAIEEECFAADVVVGAVLIPGAAAPKLVTREMLSGMKKGAVLVDVAIDQGGCFETSKVTTHDRPVFVKHDVIHYCVPNIPSGFSRTASQAISNVLMPLLVQIGDLGGLSEIIWHQIHLREGIYLYKGALTDFYISEKFNLKYTDLNLLIASKS